MLLFFIGKASCEVYSNLRSIVYVIAQLDSWSRMCTLWSGEHENGLRILHRNGTKVIPGGTQRIGGEYRVSGYKVMTVMVLTMVWHLALGTLLSSGNARSNCCHLRLPRRGMLSRSPVLNPTHYKPHSQVQREYVCIRVHRSSRLS